MISQTSTSCIYRVSHNGAPAILKVLTELGKKIESNGASALRCFDGTGSVRLLNGNSDGLLLEYIDGPKLSTLVKNNQDGQATKIICEVLDRLHSYSDSIPKEIPDLKKQFHSLFIRARNEEDNSIFYKAAKIGEELISTETEKRLLHGDIHHTNILKSTQRGWLAIDPQPLCGERTYDLANSFFNPDDMSELVETKERVEMLAEVYADHLQVDKKRILKFAFAHGGLSMSWQLDDGEDPARRLRITKLIEQLL